MPLDQIFISIFSFQIVIVPSMKNANTTQNIRFQFPAPSFCSLFFNELSIRISRFLSELRMAVMDFQIAFHTQLFSEIARLLKPGRHRINCSDLTYLLCFPFTCQLLLLKDQPCPQTAATATLLRNWMSFTELRI